MRNGKWKVLVKNECHFYSHAIPKKSNTWPQTNELDKYSPAGVPRGRQSEICEQSQSLPQRWSKYDDWQWG